MAETPLVDCQREVVRELVALAGERARAEYEIEAEYTTRSRATQDDYDAKSADIEGRFQSERESIEREFKATLRMIPADFETEYAHAEREYQEAREKLEVQYQAGKESAYNDLRDARWMCTTVLEASNKSAQEQLADVARRLAAGIDRLQKTEQAALETLSKWRQVREHAVNAGTMDCPDDGLVAKFEECVTAAETNLTRLKLQFLPRLFRGKRMVWLCLLFCLGPAYPAFQLGDWQGLVGTVLGAILASAALTTWLYVLAKRRVDSVYVSLLQAGADAHVLQVRATDRAKAAYQRQLAENQQRFEADQRNAEELFQREQAKLKRNRDTELRCADEKYPPLLDAIKRRRDDYLLRAEEKYSRQLGVVKDQYETERNQAHDKHYRQMCDVTRRRDQLWNAIAMRWRDGLNRADRVLHGVVEQCGQRFPAWSDPAWQTWSPPSVTPAVVPFGTFQFGLDLIPDGIPQDDRLKPAAPLHLTLPALLRFPDCASMLFKVSDAGRSAAEQALQSVMLRLLTAIPPSKVKFTIIDPVGLGENFAAFMHLADHDESLVASRIWTEVHHIEQRLSDLTAHMENVIQKYLRNQFPSIEAYNNNAGEVAEPFRFLVVANFPVNFNEAAARRLVSIVSSGARCGVYTLVTVDTKQPPPHGFNLSDLEQAGAIVVWHEDRFVWKDADFEPYPFQLEAPPPAEFMTNLLQVVGLRAKEASRVEVPFEFIASPHEQWWTGDSRRGINVPLGRAGATKRQHMQLGQGTAQHVLVAGKTGSGKSTLLHALITNLSLLYSPDEVELYLVDFKKGVEFKTYANYELPHARVVAIESEREFGLSVLQRLDSELKQRGDKFRALGVHDLNAYRQENGVGAMPRILVIVDEFQEFFVEDDKIAQEASLLLDRLVRQGRAFGIHVLLGSQTLGGAYTLARSTIGQMAVRIALQCSETDAHLILSDDNSAARLLSRPGEAIYNDANGLVEGNNPFQVVWLNDDRREHYLRHIQEMARTRGLTRALPQIVFEGNTPADITKNHLLDRLLRAPEWPAAPKVAHAWLGEAIAIKDPAAATFRPQTGSNLLIVGQYEESALGILGSAMLSLAAQYRPAESVSDPRGLRFYVLDGSRVDDPHCGYFARLAAAMPHPVQVGGWRDLPQVMADLAFEVDRRQKQGEFAPVFLLVFDLARFRDLRKQEDDFGFSRRGAAEERRVSPSEQFGNIVREGPGVGIHTLVWCDSLNNLNRSLDRQAQREFELRVLFQMSASDSSNLIDTPLASKLGMHRAFYCSEDQGQPEKFRPYGLLAHPWLDCVKRQFADRSAGEPVPTPA
jgi:hypothetical protein